MRFYFSRLQLSIFSFLAISAISGHAQAEYRAFLLQITNSKTNSTRQVISTLDDLQYPAYHSITKDESIQILDTWKCLKRSDHYQPICSNPKPKKTA